MNRAKPRISVEKDSDINHFGLVTFVKGLKDEYSQIVNGLVSEDQEKRVLKMLELDIFRHFSDERREMISLILKMRFEKLRSC